MLPEDYLQYPQRRYGMDHDRYGWSMLQDRPRFAWPGGKTLAISIVVMLQHYPLDQRGKTPGGMLTPYPDLRHFSLRDYGNRVGIYRLIDALDGAGLHASFAINAALGARYPRLLHYLAARGDAIVAHGWDMDHLHQESLSEHDERALIARCHDTLIAQFPQQQIDTWFSPVRSTSSRTPDLLQEAGYTVILDWLNDELPFAFRAAGGVLTAVPLSLELEDRFVLTNNQHSAHSYAQQVIDAADFLHADSQINGPRCLVLAVHPWLLGQPHRIAQFERICAHLAGLSHAWQAEPGEIAAAWREAQSVNASVAP